MDYSRFNYLVQPEDKIDPKLLMPGIGPYDKFAIHWGYAPIPEAKTSDDELKTLNAWAREQDNSPWLRFSTAGSDGADPGENTEAVGDGDAVYATTLGLKNLKRVMDNLLLPATTHEGDDWDDLEQVYGRALGQWSTELNHVTAIIGGSDSQDKHGGQPGVRFTAVPKARQKAAVKFLNENAFATPQMFLNPEILRRIEPAGALTRIRTAQLRVLNSVMVASRFSRLVEQEAMDPNAYSPAEFLADIRQGIFTELSKPQVKIDAYRRNLQRAYLDMISQRLNGANRANDDQRPMFRGELQAISNSAKTALLRTTDRTTKLHLEDLRDEIAKILDPKIQLANPPNPGAGNNPASLDDEWCWTDYAVTK
jgi:hypothetical protein